MKWSEATNNGRRGNRSAITRESSINARDHIIICRKFASVEIERVIFAGQESITQPVPIANLLTVDKKHYHAPCVFVCYVLPNDCPILRAVIMRIYEAAAMSVFIEYAISQPFNILI